MGAIAMARVFYLHYNEEEALTTVQALRAAGHVVSYHSSTETPPKIDKDNLPQIVVLSLDRLPSHAREVAAWLWEAKYRQSIPILFVGGKPEKVQATREKFPQAVYCAADELTSALKRTEMQLAGGDVPAKGRHAASAHGRRRD